jgi:hypothetical protein
MNDEEAKKLVELIETARRREAQACADLCEKLEFCNNHECAFAIRMRYKDKETEE